MLASIWLQVVGKQRAILQSLIASLAARHGTVPFEPHLTVCGAADPDAWDAAADYAGRSKLLPITVTSAGISCSPTEPFKAVVIDVANTPEMRAFRDELRRITGAGDPEAPHISLFYPIDDRERTLSWASDRRKLRAIAAQCAAALAATEFVLGNPVIVAPDRDWTNIGSWRVVRRL